MSDKTAIVTGAARGIGLATTKLFLAEGRRVAMVDRDSDALIEAARDLENTLPLIYDISDPDQVAASMPSSTTPVLLTSVRSRIPITPAGVP